MTRWLALLWLFGCSGCILLDDPMPIEQGAPMWTTTSTIEPPQGSCIQPVGNINQSQTQEPEMLHAR